jgi:hypothetical protein
VKAEIYVGMGETADQWGNHGLMGPFDSEQAALDFIENDARGSSRYENIEQLETGVEYPPFVILRLSQCVQWKVSASTTFKSKKVDRSLAAFYPGEN